MDRKVFEEVQRASKNQKTSILLAGGDSTLDIGPIIAHDDLGFMSECEGSTMFFPYARVDYIYLGEPRD